MIRTSDERGIATVIHRIWSDAFRRSGTVDYDPGRSVHIRFAPVILPALGSSIGTRSARYGYRIHWER